MYIKKIIPALILFSLQLYIFTVSSSASPDNRLILKAKLVPEAFLNNPFGYKVSLMNFQNNIPRLKIKAEPVENLYEENQIDTLYKLTYRKSKIELYKARGKSLLVSAEIQNRRIQLYRGIHTGIKKRTLYQLLPGLPETNENIVKLIDEEGLTTYIFYFNNRERLDKINIITDIE